MRLIPSPSRQSWERLLVNAILILVCLFAMLPIATTVLISFKREQDVTRKPPVIFPCDTPTQSFDLSACRWSTEGYHRVLAPKPSSSWPLAFTLTGNMLRIYLPNTMLYATVSSLLVVLLAGMSGYAFSRYRFWGHSALMTGILAITGVPLLTNLLALYQMGVTLRKASLPFYDDRIFIIIVYMGFYLPLSVWIAKGFFDAIPRELEEAALIDGCSPLGAGTLPNARATCALPSAAFESSSAVPTNSQPAPMAVGMRSTLTEGAGKQRSAGSVLPPAGCLPNCRRSKP